MNRKIKMKISVLAASFVFVVCVLVMLPVFSILALNTLFGLNIDVNIYTWLSAFWLTAIFTASTVRSK